CWTIRKGSGAGIQKQPRRADPIRCEDNQRRGLLVQCAVRTVVHHAARAAVRGERDLSHATARLQLGPVTQCAGPEGHVGTGTRTGRTAQIARSAEIATWPTVVWLRDDGTIGHPPVPAKIV